jgi:hypothetical protein
LSGVYLPALFRVAVSTVLDIYRWLEVPYRSQKVQELIDLSIEP